jgi:molybdopterin-containing oxidoreductase family membrane subunit
VDYGILLGSFGWFFMWFLLLIKQLPVIAMSEVKEVIPPRMKFPHLTESQELEQHGMAGAIINEPPLPDGGAH